MKASIQVGDLVRSKLIAAGKHLWLVIGEEIRVTSLKDIYFEHRYLMISRGSSKIQLHEDDLEKVSE